MNNIDDDDTLYYNCRHTTTMNVAEPIDVLLLVAKMHQIVFVYIGGFRGGPSRLRPPPLWRRTDAVTVLLISDNGTVLRRHALQNIQNDCHQWLSHSFIKHKNLFSAGAPPRILLGNLQRFPKPSIAGLS